MTKLMSGPFCVDIAVEPPKSLLAQLGSVSLLLLRILKYALQAVQSGGESADTNAEGHVFRVERRRVGGRSLIGIKRKGQEPRRICYSRPLMGSWRADREWKGSRVFSLWKTVGKAVE